MQYELSAGFSFCYIVIRILEALALVKVEEYCINMFIKTNYTDKNNQNISYNYIDSKNKKAFGCICFEVDRSKQTKSFY